MAKTKSRAKWMSQIEKILTPMRMTRKKKVPRSKQTRRKKMIKRRQKMETATEYKSVMFS